MPVIKLKNKIIALRKEGKTYDEIQAILKCSKGTISYHCEREGVNDIGKKKPHLSESEKLKIAEYCATHTRKEAQQHLGHSQSTISTYHNYKGKENEQTAV